MRRSKMSNIGLGLTLLVSAVLFAWLSSQPQASPWGKDYLPDLDVVDHYGQPKKFYSDLIAGKIVVITFSFTSCRSVCPVVLGRLRDVQDQLGDDARSRIHFISISIDPIPDTPEKLKKQADAFGIGEGWTFVTGTPENIDLIRYRLGERSGAAIALHKNEVLMFNDETGAWARDSAFSDLGVLAMNIRAMNPAWRDVAQHAAHMPSEGPTDGAPHVERPGQALFAKVCAGCHTVGQGKKVGPDLANVTTRREHSWLVEYLKAPQAARASGDVIAKQLSEAYPDVRMPNLGISDEDASDLLDYLERRSADLKPRAVH